MLRRTDQLVIWRCAWLALRSKGLDHPFGWNCFFATWDGVSSRFRWPLSRCGPVNEEEGMSSHFQSSAGIRAILWLFIFPDSYSLFFKFQILWISIVWFSRLFLNNQWARALYLRSVWRLVCQQFADGSLTDCWQIDLYGHMCTDICFALCYFLDMIRLNDM